MRESLKVSGILNIVFSVIYLLLFVSGWYIGLPIFVFLLVSGIIYLCSINDDDLSSKRNLLLILGIVSVPILLVSGLIILLSINKLSKKQSRAPNINPEIKRVDLLIKIGLSLISLSGFIFVLSGWNNLNSFLVILLLSIFAFIFFLLYLLFTYKIKLHSSRKLYYILFCIFISIFYLACGYYEIFGNYFSLFGYGINLFYFTLFGLVSILIYSLKLITSSKSRIYFMITSVLFSIVNLLIFLNFSFIQSLVIVNILVLFIRFKFSNNYLVNYCDILMKLFIIITFFMLFSGYSISLVILAIINLVVINYLNIIKDSIMYQIFTPIITILYSCVIIALFVNYYSLGLDIFIVLYISVLCILFIIMKLFNFNKKISVIIYLVLFFIVLYILNFISLFINGFTLLFNIIIYISLLISYYIYDYKRCIDSIDVFFIPFNLFMLLVSFLVYLSSYIHISINIILLSVMLLQCIYYYLSNNHISNCIDYIIICLLNVINIFVSLFSNDTTIVSITLVSAVLPFILYVSKYKAYKVYSYIYLLLGSYIVLLNNIYEYYISFIICIGLYFTLLLVIRKDKLFNKITVLFTLLPIITFISRLSIIFDIKLLIINIIVLIYVIYFLFKFIKNNIDLRCILFVILSFILFIIVLFNSNYIFGLYIGIISLILIIYSSLKDNLKILFVYSLVLFIINILYRLRDMWNSIPLWGYLLFAGLVIIIFATIKEIKREKK